ncbi:MAG: hypothetical protein WC900_04560 [Oscillospiraceae bacterium]|jgi:GT2 family glycosyltransferase
MSEEKKVLICCPLGDGKEYSINEWFNWIAAQTYQNYEVAVCVNGKTEESVNKKAALLEQVEIKEKKIHVLKMPHAENDSRKYRLSGAREILRIFAIKNNFDFMYWMDSDTIPFLLDAIQLLMDQKKDFISGLYFYKGTKQAVILDPVTNTNFTYDKIQELVKSGECVPMWGSGFGSLLLARSVFEKIAFDYSYKKEDWTEDFQYCEFAEKAGIERWFLARVICKHYHASEFKIEGF